MCALFPLVCEHVPSAIFIIPKLGENKIVGALVDCSGSWRSARLFCCCCCFLEERTSHVLQPPNGRKPWQRRRGRGPWPQLALARSFWPRFVTLLELPAHEGNVTLSSLVQNAVT